MAKKVTLKAVPFAEKARYDYNTHTHTPIGGWKVLEYTSGSVGEQKSAGGWGVAGQIDWRANEPFTATLRLDRLEVGRSAVRYWWIDETNNIEYPMFGPTIIDVLKELDSTKGSVTGTWIVVKKGANYGIELAE